MSHDSTGHSKVHAETGVEGVAMAWGHKPMRKAAEVLAHSPRFLAFIRAIDPTAGKSIGALLRTVAGAVNLLPVKGPWGDRANALVDMFVYEIAEILEDTADKPIEEILGDHALMDKVHHEVERFVDGTVSVLLGMAHSSKECSLFAPVVAPEVWKDRDGKEQRKPTRHVVQEMSLGRALAERLELCPKCFPKGAGPEKHEASHDAHPPAAKKAKVSPAEVCGQYVEEAKDDPAERAKREEQVALMWQRIALIEDESLRGRIDALNTRGELVMLLLAKDQGAFEQAIRQLEEPGIGRAFSKIARDIRESLDGAADGLNAACKPLIADVEAETIVVRKRMNERKGGVVMADDGSPVQIKRPNLFVRLWRTFTEGLV